MSFTALQGRSWLILMALGAALPAAWADDASGFAAEHSTSMSLRETRAPAPAPASAAPPVCFKLTMQCFRRTTPDALAHPLSHSPVANPRPGQLDLAAPDVRKVIPAPELKAMLASGEPEADSPETVRVKGSQGPPPVPSGVASLWWGLTHPAQAWRILAPAQ